MTHICVSKFIIIGSNNGLSPVTSFTKEVNPRLANRPLKTNGCLTNIELTSLVKEVTSRRQTIIWINAGTLLTGTLVTNFSEILIEMCTFWLKDIFYIHTYVLSYMQRYWSWSNVFQDLHLSHYWQSVNLCMKYCITFHLYKLSRKQIHTAWCCQG